MVSTPVISSLLEPLLGKTRLAVLTLFFMHPDERFHLREVVRRVGMALGGVQRELKLLVELEVLLKESDARGSFFRANAESPIYPDLMSMVVKTAGVGDALRSGLAGLKQKINVAFLYGSFARGAQRQASDLDLMIVGSVSFAEISLAVQRTQDGLRREINPSVFSAADFRYKAASGNHFLQGVLQAPRVFVIGTDDDLAKLAADQPIAPASFQRAGNARAAQGHRAGPPKHPRRGSGR